MNIDSTIDEYFNLQKQIYDHCGYVEDWVVIPLSDDRAYYWRIVDGEGYGGKIHYAESEEQLENEEEGDLYVDDLYVDDIYTQRFLPKWVYRGPELTLICCDPHVDGNKFLRVFRNSMECR